MNKNKSNRKPNKKPNKKPSSKCNLCNYFYILIAIAIVVYLIKKKGNTNKTFQNRARGI